MALPLHRKLLLGTLVSLTLFGASEALCRLIERDTPMDHGLEMQPHATRIWSLAPGRHRAFGVDFQVGPDGLRESAAPERPELPVVLTLGDSSVFGHGVADGATLHDALQRELHDLDAPSTVRCGGVPGYSLLQSRQLLRDVGWSLEPQVLILATQFSDQAPDLFQDAQVMAQLQTPRVRTERVLSQLALYRTLRGALAQARGQPTYASVGWLTPESQGAPRVPPGLYMSELEALLAEAHERQVGVVALQFFQRGDHRDGKEGYYGQILREVSQAHGVPVVRANEVFGRSGLSTEALYQDAVHPTAEGHALLARAVAEALMASGYPEQLPVPSERPGRRVELPAAELPPSQKLDSAITPFLDLH